MKIIITVQADTREQLLENLPRAVSKVVRVLKAHSEEATVLEGGRIMAGDMDKPIKWRIKE